MASFAVTLRSPDPRGRVIHSPPYDSRGSWRRYHSYVPLESQGVTTSFSYPSSFFLTFSEQPRCPIAESFQTNLVKSIHLPTCPTWKH